MFVLSVAFMCAVLAPPAILPQCAPLPQPAQVVGSWQPASTHVCWTDLTTMIGAQVLGTWTQDHNPNRRTERASRSDDQCTYQCVRQRSQRPAWSRPGDATGRFTVTFTLKEQLK